ncbi:hypothetical protein CC80DRAFT_504127 [Byssothecium circinans]|uniref:DUF7730 domain-containing protein n=1 Tax=Byssothecium circinans TaxID=147558 RepID=A0A6A5TWM7_9PLEO|nr:hypothetical protein CC80DRAFT_504127 [Byssothecium circinans]
MYKYGVKCQWRDFKKAARNWFKRHPLIKKMSVLIIIPPCFILYYTSVAIFWVYESLEQGWREPKRWLLKEEEIRRRKEQREKRDSIKILPTRRPRALSLAAGGTRVECGVEIPVEMSVRSVAEESKGKRREENVVVKKVEEQRIVDQLGTCQLWKLPFEVRQQVWKYAVGGNHIHIMRRKGRLGNVYCSADDPTDPIRRDLCLSTRDENGCYIPTAWPRDTYPLALLSICRQIYTETVGLLYTHNTFAFDEPDTVQLFYQTVLPSRSRLIKSIHFTPNARNDIYSRSHWNRMISWGYEPRTNELHKWWHCLHWLTTVREASLSRLTVTPTFGRLFAQPTGGAHMCVWMQNLVSSLNHLEVSGKKVDVTLTWPKDAWEDLPPHVAPPPNWWAMNKNIPSPLRMTLREYGYPVKTDFMAFFTPFHLQCLHCRDYTIIRKATKGFAEVSTIEAKNTDLVLAGDPNIATVHAPRLGDPRNSVRTRYITFHSFCGGWVEFEYHSPSKKWTATFGAREIADEEAERHLKEWPERYPVLESPHEMLQGLDDLDEGFIRTRLQSWYTIDSQTKERFYRNVGWYRE